MRYISVCSGIEAATVAWQPLGWQALWFSEIDPFCNSLLQHYYPDVPNIGDMTRCQESEIYNKYRGIADILIGGTPCQSFSLAGNRQGMDDPRGQLAGKYVNILSDYKPRWFIWENIPGVFTTNKGRDFREFISALTECGYGVCWRVLDGRDFETPQPRRRVVVVGHFGDWRPSAAVLFEQPGDQRDGEESAGQGATRTGMALKSLTTKTNRWDINGENYILFNLFSQGGRIYSDKQGCSLSASAGGAAGRTGIYKLGDTLRTLSPLEAERYMGFPDGYTDISHKGKPASDTQRFKALGNSMIPKKFRWIGRRIEQVEVIMMEEGQ